MKKKAITVRLPEDIINRMNNLTYHERITLTAFVHEAVGSHIGQYERDRGEPYPPRKRK